jgi:hypothetical protein
MLVLVLGGGGGNARLSMDLDELFLRRVLVGGGLADFPKVGT